MPLIRLKFKTHIRSIFHNLLVILTMITDSKSLPGSEYTEQNRSALATMVSNLFRHWQLDNTAQLALLGLSETNRGQIRRYQEGQPFAKSRDLLDRASLLLSIHKNLRFLYPHNRELAYAWMTKNNRAFEGKTPVELVREHGFLGLHYVRAYLDRARGI